MPKIEITDFDFTGVVNQVGFIENTLEGVFTRAAAYCKGKEFEDPSVMPYFNEDGEFILTLSTRDVDKK